MDRDSSPGWSRKPGADGAPSSAFSTSVLQRVVLWWGLDAECETRGRASVATGTGHWSLETPQHQQLQAAAQVEAPLVTWP